MKAMPSLTCLALSTALVLVALAPRPANAFWASEITQGMNNAELMASTAKLGEQFNKLKEQFTMMEKQYNQLNPGNFNLNEITGFRENSEDLKERPTNYGMEGCKLGKTSVAKDQLEMCRRMVHIRNLRFNAMVKILNDVKTRDKEIKKLMEERKGLTGADNNGQLQANTNSVNRLQLQIENDIQNGKYTLDAYAAVLAALNEEQVALAQAALKNKEKEGGLIKRLAGKVVPGAALRIGLAAASRREL